MAELSDIEYELVVQTIESAIQDQQLQLELIDHCCCSIEELMNGGHTFNNALNCALSLLSPDGIHEIEVELNQLLTPQIPTHMKITLYFSGFLAAFFLLIGFLFRFMQWPFADRLLFVGDATLIVAMTTLLLAIIRFPAAYGGQSYVRSLAGAAGGFLIGTGSIFKLMHWPGANVQILLGMLIITFVFVPLFFWQLYKREIQSSNSN